MGPYMDLHYEPRISREEAADWICHVCRAKLETAGGGVKAYGVAVCDNCIALTQRLARGEDKAA